MKPKLIWLLAATVFVVGLSQIGRAGYSVDEEFTVFAVRGIHAHGVPLLPSGLLYDRGIAYSYAADAVTAAQGAQGAVLVRARALSLICAALIVWLTFRYVAEFAGETSGLLAALLVTTSVPFWATATSARFYAPFLLVCLAVIRTISTPRTSGTLRTLCTLVFLSALARWLHELAFLLAVVPVICLIAGRDRRRWLMVTAAVAAGLALAQAAIFALHALQPSAGETMVRRFFLWQVLNLFERPGDRQFMIPIVVMAIAWVAAPKRAWLISVAALSIAAMIVTFSIARATNGAPLSLALVRSVLTDGSRYPMDMFWHIARNTPLTLLLALAGLMARLVMDAAAWPRSERVLHLLWMGWVLWFGVIDSGITANYLLLPMSFMMMAIAVDLHAIRRASFSPARQAASIAMAAVVVVALIGDQWRGAGSLLAKLEAARPTLNAAAIAEIRGSLQPSDRVVCTDELGCLMTIGRIDRWLALDDYVRERFLVRSGDGPATGVYTGVPAAFRPIDLFARNADGSFPDRILIVDIFKEYPIGNSRSWLPRAIDEDGVRVETLLETSQARVLEVRAPERAARLSERRP